MRVLSCFCRSCLMITISACLGAPWNNSTVMGQSVADGSGDITSLPPERISADALPDLIPDDFLLSGSRVINPIELLGLRMNLYVSNVGQGDMVGGANVGFYLSADSIITTGDRLLLGGREYFADLAAGQRTRITIYGGMRVPDDYPLGPAYLGVIIDEFNAIGESDESNNTAWYHVHLGEEPIFCGDVNADGVLSASDVDALRAFYFDPNAEWPLPLSSGDLDCSGTIDLADVIHLADFFYGRGAPPCCPGWTTLEELAGDWVVDVWEYALAYDTTQKADWVLTRGLTGFLTVGSTGYFSVTPALDAGFGSDFGMLTIDADSIYWNGENDEEWVHYHMMEPTLSVYWPETSFVDMDGDGRPEDCWLRVVFRRP